MTYTEEQLTDWYPPHIKPVRVGVYEIKDGDFFKYWNGKFWGIASTTVFIAKRFRGYKSIIQDDYWRGLKTEGGG